jgi:ATP synthase protein I
LNVNIRLLAKKVWLKQALVLIASVVVVAWFDWLIAKSLLIGGLIYLLPSISFALMALRGHEKASAGLVLDNMYRGAMGKFLLTSTGFIITFVVLMPINIVSLFLSFFIMTILGLVMSSRINLS